VKSTERIINQINIVQDEVSDVLVLDKRNNLRRLRSEIEINIEEDDYSNKRKSGMEKS